MKYLTVIKEMFIEIKNDTILLLITLNVIPMCILGIYLKILDDNFWNRGISFETINNHHILSIWYFSHIAIVIILYIYKYFIKK